MEANVPVSFEVEKIAGQKGNELAEQTMQMQLQYVAAKDDGCVRGTCKYPKVLAQAPLTA